MVQALSRVPDLRHRAGAVAQAASGAVPPALVVSLDDPRAADPEVSGRKAATLARARRLGFPVLPGFVVTR